VLCWLWISLCSSCTSHLICCTILHFIQLVTSHVDLLWHRKFYSQRVYMWLRPLTALLGAKPMECECVIQREKMPMHFCSFPHADLVKEMEAFPSVSSADMAKAAAQHSEVSKEHWSSEWLSPNIWTLCTGMLAAVVRHILRWARSTGGVSDWVTISEPYVPGCWLLL